MRMGRLFWKFFFFFWLAQMATATGVGVAIWVEHGPNDGRRSGEERMPPPPPYFGNPAGLAPPIGPPPAPDRLPLSVAPIVTGSLVSLLFAAILAWYFAMPIRSLRTAFASVAEGKLDTRIGGAMGDRRDELADLGVDFDHMAARLQSLIVSQRRLFHDVSHELRSPLARMQVAVGLIRQQPERSGEFVERFERDTARMDKLVGELLTLARIEAGMTGRLDERVNVDEVLDDVVEDARVEAEAKDCKISLDGDHGAVVRGSHELLHRAIENIVRNALKHSPQGGTVAILARAGDDGLLVSVSDSGPGVFDGDLASIFDPFVRSGPDRSPGYGLGLAITRRVAEAHGGSVSAENRAVGGLAVTMKLPRR